MLLFLNTFCDDIARMGKATAEQECLHKATAVGDASKAYFF